MYKMFEISAETYIRNGVYNIIGKKKYGQEICVKKKN